MIKYLVPLLVITSTGCGESFRDISIRTANTMLASNTSQYKIGYKAFHDKCISLAKKCNAAGDKKCEVGYKCLDDFKKYSKVTREIDAAIWASIHAIVIANDKPSYNEAMQRAVMLGIKASALAKMAWKVE